MSNDCTITLTGTMTRDPEMRYTPGGTAVCSFGLARNSRVKNDAGQWGDGDPHFYDVVCWKDLAENVADSLVKGQRVIVTGELNYRSWENDQGEKRSKLEIRADEVGPSLRWATAEVTKVSRNGGDGSGSRASSSGDSGNPFA